MKRLYIGFVAVALISLIIDISIALGWTLAWVAVFLRRFIRYRYVKGTGAGKKFNFFSFLLYSLLSFAIALGTIGLAIFLTDYVNPYAILIVFVLDYVLLLIEQYRGSVL